MGTVAAFIPVRAGSKSIPNKNIRTFAGKPLIHWAVQAALDCTEIDAVFVSTDSCEIRKSLAAFLSKKLNVIGRSPETATDTASTESAMLEFARNHTFSTIILMQVTSPFITAHDLSTGLAMLRRNNGDSVVSVTRQRRFIWQVLEDSAVPVNYDPRHRPRRQDFEGFLVENGAFYILSRDELLKTECRLSGKVLACEMGSHTYIELDEMQDWIMAEAWACRLDKEKRSSYETLKDIRLLVTDVDGVLTDSGMYYTENGDEYKKFNTRDGKGFEILRELGIRTAIMTGETTDIVSRRAKKIKADFLFMGCADKQKTVTELCKELDISLAQVAFIGDDTNDKEALCLAGFAACPNNAIDEVRAVADYICKRNGGDGCVREVCDLIAENRLRRDTICNP